MSSSSSSSSTSSASDSDSGGRHGDAVANPSSAKRQKILVDKKVLRTSAMLLKQKMLSHDSIAKAKKVYANQMGSSPVKIAEWYCEFMALKIMQGDYDASVATLSPGGIVDEFWHAHCLDTAGYANFFKDVNPPGGEMVHHDALKSQDSDEMIEKRQEKTRAVSHWSFDLHLVYFYVSNIMPHDHVTICTFSK